MDDGNDDAALCRAIVVKFKAEGEGSVSYAEIARGAWEAGRTKLATMVSPSRFHPALYHARGGREEAKYLVA